MEFKTGLILLQKQNNELLNGVDLSQACLPYISIGITCLKKLKIK